MIQHTAVDGSTVEIDGPLDLSRPVSSFFTATLDGEPQEFGTGDKTFAEHVVQRDQGPVVFHDEFQYQGGRLRLGSDLLVDSDTQQTLIRRTAVWEGTAYSLKTFIYGGESNDLITRLDHFEFEERPTGLALRPRDKSRTKIDYSSRPPLIFKELPPLGHIQVVPLTPGTAHRQPKWQGKNVRGGELFKEERGADLILFLIGHSAITLIDPRSEVRPDEAVNHSSRLLVAWKQ